MSELEIQKFSADNLKEVAELIKSLWNNSESDMPEQLLSLYNEYVLRYYFVEKSPFNLVAIKDDKIVACLLAANAKDIKHNLADDWIKQYLTDKETIEYYNNFKKYIDSMRDAEHLYAKDNEAVLLFFGSAYKGAGKFLMNELEKRCKEQGVNSMLLWTDESCNYNYYYKKGFEEVLKTPSKVEFDGKYPMTWIFRKPIS